MPWSLRVQILKKNTLSLVFSHIPNTVCGVGLGGGDVWVVCEEYGIIFIIVFEVYILLIL